MQQRLSSRLTFFYRFVFPLLWIPGFGLATLVLWTGGTTTGEPIPIEVKFIFLAGMIAGSLTILWLALRIRTVYLERDRLVVSEGLREIRIPLTAIVEVKESRMWNPKMVTVVLDRSSEYPDRVVFIAPMTFQFVWSDHPVVRELRGHIDRAKRERTSSMR